MTCPLLVKLPGPITHDQVLRCPERSLTSLTLFAWCSSNWQACPDYRRHMEQEKEVTRA